MQSLSIDAFSKNWLKNNYKITIDFYLNNVRKKVRNYVKVYLLFLSIFSKAYSHAWITNLENEISLPLIAFSISLIKFKGKPKKRIIGKEVLWHFHIYIIGDDFSSASSFCNMARQYISHKMGYKTSQNKNDDLIVALSYVHKQCISYWKYGEYFHSKKIG